MNNKKLNNIFCKFIQINAESKFHLNKSVSIKKSGRYRKIVKTYKF